MRILSVLALVLTTLISNLALANLTSVQSSCVNNNCKVKACLNNQCLEFKDASEAQFINGDSVLKLTYPRRNPRIQYYTWSTRSWSNSAPVVVVARPAQRNAPVATVRVEVPKPEVSADVRIGGVSVEARIGTSRPAPTRTVVRGEELTPTLISQIQRACDDAFMFDAEKECNSLLLTSKRPSSDLALLRVIDAEVIGQSDKLEMLKLSMNLNVTTLNVKSCMSNMSFSSGKRDCLKIAARLEHRLVIACTSQGSFDSDKLNCLRTVSR